MRLPICEADAANGFLCAACQAKFYRGELAQADVDVSNILYKERGPLSLDYVSVARAFDCGKVMVVVTDSEAGLLIGRRGKVAAVLAKELGKPVKIIQRTGDLRKMVEELILPVRVQGINEVFAPSGKTHRIRIHRSDSPRLPLSVKEIEAALDFIGNEKTKIVFE